MRQDIANYKTIVFDCDGVILDSNGVKTAAFYRAALPYGENKAQALVDHHIANGGISRYEKFAFFFREILRTEPADGEMEKLLSIFGDCVTEGMMICAASSALEKLRYQTSSAKWLVASGSDQKELREVLQRRKLSALFDGGVFGSPRSKKKILETELQPQDRSAETLFIGDSAHDYKVASALGLDFVFLDLWSEALAFRDHCLQNGICVRPDLNALL